MRGAWAGGADCHDGGGKGVKGYLLHHIRDICCITSGIFVASRCDAEVIEEILVPWLHGQQRRRWKGGDAIKPDKVGWREKRKRRGGGVDYDRISAAALVPACSDSTSFFSFALNTHPCDFQSPALTCRCVSPCLLVPVSPSCLPRSLRQRPTKRRRASARESICF